MYSFKEVFIEIGSKNCVDRGVRNLIDEKNLFLVEDLGRAWELKVMNSNDIVIR